MKASVKSYPFIALLVLSSCEDILNYESISPVIDTDLPATCSPNETISFKVFHVAFNGCGEYSKHEVVENGNVVSVRFYVRYPKAKICPDNIPTLETTYYYKAGKSGDVYFRFFQDNYDGQEYLLDTLRVQ